MAADSLGPAFFGGYSQKTQDPGIFLQPGYLNRVMLGCRSGIGAGYCALALALVFGCGGAVTHSNGEDEPGAGTSNPTQAGRGGSAAGGSTSVAGMPGRAGAGGKSVDEPEPVQTACPVDELPPPSIARDPYRAGSGDCPPGSGCYPFVEHPAGRGCDARIYGTVCVVAGVGTLGDLCGAAVGDWCAPGFVCVVGQPAGRRGAALCKPGGANQWAGGLICGDLDVSGFGVCG